MPASVSAAAGGAIILPPASRPDAGEHSLPATVNKYFFAAAGPCGRGDRGNFESAARNENFRQIEHNVLSAAQWLFCFMPGCEAAERANTTVASWTPADRGRVAVRRSTRVRRDSNSTQKMRVWSSSFHCFWRFSQPTLLIGGRAFIDPMLRAAAEARRTQPDGRGRLYYARWRVLSASVVRQQDGGNHRKRRRSLSRSAPARQGSLRAPKRVLPGARTKALPTTIAPFLFPARAIGTVRGLQALSKIVSASRFPPRVKCGAGIFRIML